MSETKPSNGPERRQFLDRLGEYTEIRFQQMRWASKAGALLARFEAEGGNRDDIRDGFDLGKLNPEERQAEVRRQMKVAGYMGVTSWSEDGQGSFTATFDAPTDELDTLGAGGAPIGSRLSLARSHADGYNSGKLGAELSACPFAAESEEAKAWEVGFHDGIEDRKPPKRRASPANGTSESEQPAEEAPEQPPAPAETTGGRRRRTPRAVAPAESIAEEPPAAIH